MASRIAFMLRAFAYPNYRLFFGGQIVSLIGSWISMTATSWLVYRLTGSAMALGVVGFAGQFPGFVMGPFAGAFLDRWDRHRVLVVTQTTLDAAVLCAGASDVHRVTSRSRPSSR